MTAVNTDVDEPASGDVPLSDVLAALAEPGRLATVALLADFGPQTCKGIPEQIGQDWGKSTLSHHLRVLREAGLTHTQVQGAYRLVSLRRDELEQRFPGLLAAVLAGSRAAAPAS
jgi:DNA-binding transcriptional ArsR family regulator